MTKIADHKMRALYRLYGGYVFLPDLTNGILRESTLFYGFLISCLALCPSLLKVNQTHIYYLTTQTRTKFSTEYNRNTAINFNLLAAFPHFVSDVLIKCYQWSSSVLINKLFYLYKLSIET